MPQHLHRPPSATFACVLQLLFATWGCVHGMYEMNLARYGESGSGELVLVFVMPLLAAICGIFMLRGKNWARLAYWVLYGGFLVWVLTAYPAEVTVPPTVVYVVCAVFLALPNAHWFFTGRDYRRRPGYRKGLEDDRPYNGSRPEGYEY